MRVHAAHADSCNVAAGILYPLERAFLYTFKPELIPYEHIESVEFERQQSNMHAATLRTFDLSITIKPDAALCTKNFQFRCVFAYPTALECCIVPWQLLGAKERLA